MTLFTVVIFNITSGYILDILFTGLLVFNCLAGILYICTSVSLIMTFYSIFFFVVLRPKKKKFLFSLDFKTMLTKH